MKKRVIIIGLDGVTFDVIKPLMEKGLLPTFHKLSQESAFGNMQSTFPPLTCPAWFSFSTGKNPGKFGAFNFYMLKKGSYQIFQPTNELMFKQKELWDILNKAGYRCGIINNPITYPVKPIEDYMVAGFLAPSEKTEYTYPKDLKEKLDQIAGGYELDASHGEKEDQIVISGCFRVMEKRFKVIKYFLENDSSDFYMGVFTATDRIQHQLLNKYFSDNPNQKAEVAPIIEKFFITLDGYIGELLKLVSPDDFIFVMSDHGFNKRDKGFQMNQWLIKEGYLKVILRKSVLEKVGFTQRAVKRFLDRHGLKVIEKIIRAKTPGFIQKFIPGGTIEGSGQSVIDMMQRGLIDWKNTKAIALPGGIYINTKDRPEGIVEPGSEYNNLINEITNKLKNLVLANGTKIEIRTLRPADIYQGPFTSEAPDIMCVIENYNYGMITNIVGEANQYIDNLKLAHHRENAILFAMGPGIKKGFEIKNASIIDVAPTVLHLYNLPIPSDIDGRVLREIFEKGGDFDQEISYKKISEKEKIEEALESIDF